MNQEPNQPSEKSASQMSVIPTVTSQAQPVGRAQPSAFQRYEISAKEASDGREFTNTSAASHLRESTLQSQPMPQSASAAGFSGQPGANFGSQSSRQTSIRQSQMSENAQQVISSAHFEKQAQLGQTARSYVTSHPTAELSSGQAASYQAAQHSVHYGGTSLTTRQVEGSASVAVLNGGQQSSGMQMMKTGYSSNVGQGSVTGGQTTTTATSNQMTSTGQMGISHSTATSGQVVSGASQTVSHHQSGRVISERVVEREGERYMIGERIVEHEVMVPKKITREEVYEKTVVIPEKVYHEEMSEDVRIVREKIIEIGIPVVREKVVEIPEIEYVEKVVEIPEIIVQERIVEVPVVEYVNNIVEVPKIIPREKIVEVPEIVYRDVPVRRTVEYPEVQEKIVYKKVPVPQFVEVNVPQYKDTIQEKEIIRSVPVPVEAITTCKFKLPRLRPKYVKVEVPLYVPRFVEVPIPADSLPNNAAAINQAQRYLQQLTQITQAQSVSLCDVESLAHDINKLASDSTFTTLSGVERITTCVSEAWHTNRIAVDPTTLTYTHYEVAAPLIQ